MIGNKLRWLRGNRRRMLIASVLAAAAGLSATTASNGAAAVETALGFDRARENAVAASEAFERSIRMVRAWIEQTDPKTGLIPRDLQQRRWLAKDSAADNYPFWVLTAWYTDRSLYYPRINHLPEWYPLEADRTYEITRNDGGTTRRLSGRQLIEGLEVHVDHDDPVQLILRPWHGE